MTTMLVHTFRTIAIIKKNKMNELLIKIRYAFLKDLISNLLTFISYHRCKHWSEELIKFEFYLFLLVRIFALFSIYIAM